MNSIFKGKGIIVGYAAALLLAAGLAFALSALPPGAGRERQEAAAAAKYKEALALMDGGSMDEVARRRAADPMPTPSPTPCFRPTSPASAGSGPDDPYNAADFTGPEDFYEENRDAFDNIDDAEAYWQENS